MSVWPMSAIVLKSGCFALSPHDHQRADLQRRDDREGRLVAEFWIASSVTTWPSVIDLSAYICALTCWKPIAGPPLRISTLTPVSWPECDQRAGTPSSSLSIV